MDVSLWITIGFVGDVLVVTNVVSMLWSITTKIALNVCERGARQDDSAGQGQRQGEQTVAACFSGEQPVVVVVVILLFMWTTTNCCPRVVFERIEESLFERKPMNSLLFLPLDTLCTQSGQPELLICRG